MKRFTLFIVCCGFISMVCAQDVQITINKYGKSRTHVVGTNDIKLESLQLDGTDGGVDYRVTARLKGSEIAFDEQTSAASNGIREQTRKQIFVPTNRLPQTIGFSQMTVIVSRAESPLKTQN